MPSNSSDTIIANTLSGDDGAESALVTPASGVRTRYDSPQEAVGAMVRSLMAAGKRVSFEEIQLMLIVRLKMATDLSQQAILQDALALLQTAGQR